MCVWFHLSVQTGDNDGDDDVGEGRDDGEKEDYSRRRSVWRHSRTLTNGETLYVYESH